jgi:hypothetical protein
MLDCDDDFPLDESPRNDNEIDHEFDEVMMENRNQMHMAGRG